VAFWDNRSCQHHALWDYFPATRSGTRVTVQGDRPFYRAANLERDRGRLAQPEA
jgi:taurine dioxygenase